MNCIFDVMKNMERVSFDGQKIPMRNKFVINEIERIWEKLDLCYDKLEVLKMDDNKRFFKIIDLLEELSEKSSNLEQFLKDEDLV